MQSKKEGVGIEAEHSSNGLVVLQALRRTDYRFKRCRIKSGLQAQPEDIPLFGVVSGIFLLSANRHQPTRYT
jgi:hypothetical protein